jgi:hypothetical protein
VRSTRACWKEKTGRGDRRAEGAASVLCFAGPLWRRAPGNAESSSPSRSCPDRCTAAPCARGTVERAALQEAEGEARGTCLHEAADCARREIAQAQAGNRSLRQRAHRAGPAERSRARRVAAWSTRLGGSRSSTRVVGNVGPDRSSGAAPQDDLRLLPRALHSEPEPSLPDLRRTAASMSRVRSVSKTADANNDVCSRPTATGDTGGPHHLRAQ